MQYDVVMHELGNWQSPMLRELFSPQPALRPFIKDYCALTQEWACSSSEQWYILPDNSAYLIFYLAGKKGTLTPSLRLIGPRSRHLIINRHHRYFTFIVSFRPGGLAPFINTALADLCDNAIDACELLPWVDEVLISRLASASQQANLCKFITILEEALLYSMPAAVRINPTIQEFTRLISRFPSRVADISDQLGITERHLRTLSQKHIGQSPKSALQIERFTRSLIISNHAREWASIAHESGYYDQSHMIAEYQKMTGKSPEKLFG
ncbi:MAG: AraC family transcriptional regulator [Roseivirga sp.]